MDSSLQIKDPATLGGGIPRLAEIIITAIGLVTVAPLILVAAAAVAFTSRGPTIFRQRRVGQGGCTFVFYKLRTMRDLKDGPQVTSGDDERITWVGRILRRTKLDELPTLWNVLKGDMSLVGPRPEVPRYVDLTKPAWELVLRVRPGLTDPVTLCLRNEEKFLETVEGDRERFYVEILQPLKLRGSSEYLEKRTWWLDVKVLCKSALAVFFYGEALPPNVNEVLAEVSAQRQRWRDGGYQ